MKKMFKTCMTLALCVLIAAASFLCAAAKEDLMTAPMYFNDDGRFKILHITDTHLHENNVRDTMRLIGLACDTEQPDLVMLTGDLAPEDTYEETVERIDALMQAFESRHIPVAVSFGNHDSENGAYTREEVMALYNSYDCSISMDDGDALTGCGTYLVPLCRAGEDTPCFNLWVFDSGDYDDEGHYANVAEDQVAWYRETSAAIERDCGKKIYSLAFQHIIVPQIYDALEKVNHRTLFSFPRIYTEGEYYRFSPNYTNYGMLNEYPCPGFYDHGQFDAMVGRGDVLAIFTGHDHTNAFGVRYKGIDIVNSLSTRYNGEVFSTQYGYRVVELRADAPDTYETRVVRWYDFARDVRVKAAADRDDLRMLSGIRFMGFFQKTFTDIVVRFAELFTGRTVRYPD